MLSDNTALLNDAVSPEPIAVHNNDKRKSLSKTCIPKRSSKVADKLKMKYDSDDQESFLSDNQSECLLEIGPPKFLKYQTEYEKDYDTITTPKKEDEPDSFFSKELKQYTEGGFPCDFCHSLTIAYNSEGQSNSYCCTEFKEYVDGVLSYYIYLDSLRKKMTYDFRQLTFKPRPVRVKKAIRDDGLGNKSSNNFSPVKQKPKRVPRIKNESKQSVEKGAGSRTSERDGDEMGVNKTYGKVRPKISRQSKISKADTDDSMYDGPTADSKEKQNIINYFLSNKKYLENGWTQNLEYERFGLAETKYSDNRVDSGAVATTIDLWAASQLSVPIIKFYKNKKPFQTILPDRTGNIYYPNGRLALLLSDNGEYRSFIAYPNEKNNATQIASFDTNGNGFCNYPNGNLRYQINYIGGINFDQNGMCIRRWLFPEDENGFHPITFLINEYMSMQIHSRSKIIFNFRSKFGSCKFLIKLRKFNKHSSAYDGHFRSFLSDETYLKIKNRAQFLLELMQETMEQAESKSTKKPSRCRERSSTTAHSTNLKTKLPKIVIQRKQSITTFQSDYNNSGQNLGKLNFQDLKSSSFKKGMSDNNSICFSLQSSSFNQLSSQRNVFY